MKIIITSACVKWCTVEIIPNHRYPISIYTHPVVNLVIKSMNGHGLIGDISIYNRWGRSVSDSLRYPHHFYAYPRVDGHQHTVGLYT